MHDMEVIPPRLQEEKIESQVASQLIHDKTLEPKDQQPVESPPKYGTLSFDEKFKRKTEKPKYNDVQVLLMTLNTRFGLLSFSLPFLFHLP